MTEITPSLTQTQVTRTTAAQTPVAPQTQTPVAQTQTPVAHPDSFRKAALGELKKEFITGSADYWQPLSSNDKNELIDKMSTKLMLEAENKALTANQLMLEAENKALTANLERLENEARTTYVNASKPTPPTPAQKADAEREMIAREQINRDNPELAIRYNAIVDRWGSNPREKTTKDEVKIIDEYLAKVDIIKLKLKSESEYDEYKKSQTESSYKLAESRNQY